MIVFTDDKDRLQRHFEKDPVLFSYHLGDLDDFYFPYCQWASIYGERPHIVECVLIYTGGPKPVVLAFGLTERFDELMADLVDLLPAEFYCHFHSSSLPALTSRYDADRFGTFVKMKLGNFKPINDLSLASETVRLTPEHTEELRALYQRAYPGNYFVPRMLETGKYLGLRRDGRLVAATGVHVDSAEYKISVLGNIATDPDYRNKGLATRLTSLLVTELTGEGRMVCLNVKADNEPAVHCYQRIGFEIVHEYEEGYFTRLP